MSWIHEQFAWRKGCDSGCKGRKGRCCLPFRKDGKGSRKFAAIEHRTRTSFFWRKLKLDLGWVK